MSGRWVPVFRGSIPEVITLQAACEAQGIPTDVPDMNLMQVDPFLRGANALSLALCVPEDRCAEALTLVPARRASDVEVPEQRQARELDGLGRRVRWCLALGVTWPIGVWLGARYLRASRGLHARPADHAWTVGTFWACLVLTLASLVLWASSSGWLDPLLRQARDG